MRTVARLVVVGWLLAALAMLAMDGRLGVFCALATPGTLLTVAAGVLIRQQRAPSMLERTLLPERYRMADDLHQPLAAVVVAAEQEAIRTLQPYPGDGAVLHSENRRRACVAARLCAYRDQTP